MTWHVSIDDNTCIGSGLCAATAPDLFKLESGYGTPIHDEIEPDELALDAADACPVMAILVKDGDEEVGPRP